MLGLSAKSLWNRRFVALLTVFGIALSVALILGVERLRGEARASFANSVSGIDLIVAARGNDVQILMATVFGVGSTGAGIGWDSFELVEEMPQVAWAMPVMMGDNHRGYPVIGTIAAYFDHYRHSGGRALSFAEGGVFDTADGAVVGAEVAAALGHGPGSVIVNAHGAGAVSFDVHDEAPFTVTGVLAATGTAVDRMVFVSLEGFDAIHAERAPVPDDPLAAAGPAAPADTAPAGDGDDAHRHEDEAAEHPEGGHDAHDNEADGPSADEGHDHRRHEPGQINAVFAGLKDRGAVLAVQRRIAEYRGDALTAVLPNLALLQLWSITGTAETALRLMAGAVAIAGLVGMVVMLSASLETRRREFAILRSVGATPAMVFALIVFEAGLLLLGGLVLGYVLLTAALAVADPVLAARFGLTIGTGLPSAREGLLIALVFCSGLLASIVPAVRIYRMTLADGLSIRF